MTSLLRRWLPPALTNSARSVSTKPPSSSSGLREVSSRLLSDDADATLRSFVQQSGALARVKAKQQGARAGLADVAQAAERAAYTRHSTRPWARGDVYTPRDLKPAEMVMWRRRAVLPEDFVDQMGFNPLDNYRNFSLISENMTAFGRILPGKRNGLRPVNQRKMAKAIRRAVGLGIHPSVHLHPEILLANKMNHGTLPTTAPPAKAGRL